MSGRPAVRALGFARLLVIASLLVGQTGFVRFSLTPVSASASVNTGVFESPIVEPVPGATPSITPAPTTLATPSVVVSPSLTAGPTAQASPGVTVTATVAAPTRQATPTIAATASSAPASPVPSPSPSATPAVPPAARSAISPSLSLLADLPFVEPGGLVTFTLQAGHATSATLNALALTVTLPTELMYVSGSDRGLTPQSPSPHTLQWTASAVRGRQAITSTFVARTVGTLAAGRQFTATLTAASPQFTRALSVTTPIEVVGGASDAVQLSATRGGWLHTRDGRVAVHALPGSVNGAARLAYAPVTALPAPLPGLRQGFILTATLLSGQGVARFEPPLRLLSKWQGPGYRPHPAGFPARLYRYDAAASKWQPVEGTASRQADQLSAPLERDGLYAVAESNPPNVQMEPAAKVRGAQTQLYGLSASYQYPFDLPPGRGGLTPVLGLRYASSAHMSLTGHYSYAGIGWDIVGADRIVQQLNSADQPMPMTLYLQGQVYTLSRSVSWTELHVKEDTRIRVAWEEASGAEDRIVVTMPDGVKYTFKGQKNGIGTTNPLGTGNTYPESYRWWNGTACNTPTPSQTDFHTLPLAYVTDLNGNRIDYTWTAQASTQLGYHGGSDGAAGEESCHYVRAIRLNSITYNGGRVKVELNYDNGTQRYDRPSSYDVAGTYRFFPIYRLTGAKLWVQGNDQVWRAPREWILGQSLGNSGSPAQNALNLTSLTEGVPGVSGAPSMSTSFSNRDTVLAYDNSWSFLQTLTGPLGGRVTFDGANPPGQQPPQITSRTERDLISDATGARDARWEYQGSGWDEDTNGFSEVWLRRPDGSCEKHEFHQKTVVEGVDITHLAGRTLKVTTYSACPNWAPGAELARVENTWTRTQDRLPIEGSWFLRDGGGNWVTPIKDQPHFVYLSDSRTFQEGKSVLRTTYSYDPNLQTGWTASGNATLTGQHQYGNLTRVDEYEGQGVVGGGFPTLVRFRLLHYRPNGDTWVTGQPLMERVYTGGSVLASEEHFYYDYQNSYDIRPVDDGLLTRHEIVSVPAPSDGLNPTISRRYTYDTYGNLASEQDFNNNTPTTYVYDSWYRAYKLCVQNPLGQRTRYSYYGVPTATSDCSSSGGATAFTGARFGLLAAETEPNGNVTSYTYDDFGRVYDVIVPPDGSATRRLTYRAFAGIDSSHPFWVHEIVRDHPAGGNYYQHRWYYYDGFGRLLQSKQELSRTASPPYADHLQLSYRYTWRDGVERAAEPKVVIGEVQVADTSVPVMQWPNSQGDWNAADLPPSHGAGRRHNDDGL